MNSVKLLPKWNNERSASTIVEVLRFLIGHYRSVLPRFLGLIQSMVGSLKQHFSGFGVGGVVSDTR